MIKYNTSSLIVLIIVLSMTSMYAGIERELHFLGEAKLRELMTAVTCAHVLVSPETAHGTYQKDVAAGFFFHRKEAILAGDTFDQANEKAYNHVLHFELDKIRCQDKQELLAKNQKRLSHVKAWFIQQLDMHNQLGGHCPSPEYKDTVLKLYPTLKAAMRVRFPYGRHNWSAEFMNTLVNNEFFAPSYAILLHEEADCSRREQLINKLYKQ